MSTEDLKKRLARIMRRLGFGDCASTVYSDLLFIADPVPLGKISADVGYSPTAVSMALSELEDSGLVIREKKSRRYLYTADVNFIRKFEIGVRELLEDELRPFRRALEKHHRTFIRERAGEKVHTILTTVREAEKRLRTYIRDFRTSEVSERREGDMT